MSVKSGLATILNRFETERAKSNTIIQELAKQLDQTNALLLETRSELKKAMSECMHKEINVEVTR